jgi:hypothetical protein
MNPAFFVDGKTETSLFDKLCKVKPKYTRLELGGESVSAKAYAERIHAKAFRNNKHYPIIVIIDRDKREETCNQLHNQIIDELKKINEMKIANSKITLENIRLFIADINFESWVAPFIQEDGSIGYNGKDFETISASSFLKQFNHKKITDANRIFPDIPHAKLAEISPSFHALYHGIKDICSFEKVSYT